MVPANRSTSREIEFIRVLLPEPFGPSRATTSPSDTRWNIPQHLVIAVAGVEFSTSSMEPLACSE